MTELEEKQADCPYCNGHSVIESFSKGTVWYLNPRNGGYEKWIREREHINVQVDIDDGGSDVFWFNYCPMCGRKLGEEE